MQTFLYVQHSSCPILGSMYGLETPEEILIPKDTPNFPVIQIITGILGDDNIKN